jgi:hypothetical protein
MRNLSISALLLLLIGSVVLAGEPIIIFSDDFDDKTTYGGGNLQKSDRIYSGTYTGTWTTVPAQDTGGWDDLGSCEGSAGTGHMQLGRNKAAGNKAGAIMVSGVANSLADEVTITFDFGAGYNQGEWDVDSPEVPFVKGFDGSGNELFQLRTSKGSGQWLGYIYTSASDQAFDEFNYHANPPTFGFEIVLRASSYDLKFDMNDDGDFEDTGEVVTGISYVSGSNDGTFGELAFYAEPNLAARIDNIVVSFPGPPKGTLLTIW